MSIRNELLGLEHEAWHALSTSGDDAAAFYERVLADDVLVLLPGGMMFDDRAEVIESMRGDPWDAFELADERVLRLDDDCAIVAYRATARREEAEYTGLFNSTYVRQSGEWHLALHQQTPL